MRRIWRTAFSSTICQGLVSRHAATKSHQLGSGSDKDDVLLSKDITFTTAHKMLAKQARRTVIIEIPHRLGCATYDSAYELLSKHGAIAYLSCLATFSDKSRFLIEFESASSATSLLNLGEDGSIVSRMLTLRPAGDTVNISERADMPWKHRRFPSHDITAFKNTLNRQNSMDDQIGVIKDMLTVTTDEIRCRYLLLSAFCEIFRDNLGIDHIVRPFGSSLTGAGMPGSDMDIAIISKKYLHDSIKELPDLYTLLDKEHTLRTAVNRESVEILQTAKNLIESHLQVENLELVLQARVPLVKFNYPLLGLPVDVTVNHMLGFSFLEMINWYVRYDERVPAMLNIVRKWAEARSLVNRGPLYKGFTPFMLQMLILIYLVRVGVIPAANKIGRTRRDTFSVRKPPSLFDADSRKNNQPAPELLHSFFEYFAKNGLRAKAHCIMHGTIRSRNKPNSRLWIRNPFHDSLNIAGQCDGFHAQKMVAEMRKTVRDLNRFGEKRGDTIDWGLTRVLFDCGKT